MAGGPRLHTAIFSKVYHWTKNWPILVESPLEIRRERKRAERRQHVSAIAKKLLWSDKRLAMFKQVVVEYRQKSTIENYLRLRRQFPEIEILIAEFGGMDPLYILGKQFRKQGIDQQLIAGCLDAESHRLTPYACS